MIKIKNKDKNKPKVLKTNPNPENCNRLNKYVREILFNSYSGKCGYCESILGLSSPKTIDHYRPKKKVKENSKHKGYSWLVCEWSNLIACCQLCNNKKHISFPITDEKDRIYKKQADPKEWNAKSKSFLSENPLLLHPEIDNPEDHLIILRNGVLEGKSDRGKQTINILDLNRDPLVLERFKILNKIITDLKNKAKDVLFQRQKNLIEAKEYNEGKYIKSKFKSTFQRIAFKCKGKTRYLFVWQFAWNNYDILIRELPEDEEIIRIITKAYKIYKSLKNN